MAGITWGRKQALDFTTAEYWDSTLSDICGMAVGGSVRYHIVVLSASEGVSAISVAAKISWKWKRQLAPKHK
ncbi:MAG: hypothetical protein F6K16_33510 [Symploca sp. SIO2B6]|nr:hypothetical protein [Symploca sp. SIO2B6]